MTIDEIETKLWEYYLIHNAPISRRIILNIIEIPKYRDLLSIGIRLIELNKKFRKRYYTEIFPIKCLNCNDIILHNFNNKFCGSSCAAIWNNTGKKFTQERKHNISVKKKGIPSASKGKCSKITKKCVKCDNTFNVYPNSLREFCSRKCNPNLGGIREGSGNSKSGYYKGIFSGSTYELVWIIYRLDHGLKVTRFKGCIEQYGKKYFPDFDINGDIVEIKGFWSEDVELKTNMAISQGYNISVKYKKDLEKEFNWVKANYTYKTLDELYDGHRPKYKYICHTCKREFETDRKRTTINKFCSRSCVGHNASLLRIKS